MHLEASSAITVQASLDLPRIRMLSDIKFALNDEGLAPRGVRRKLNSNVVMPSDNISLK